MYINYYFRLLVVTVFISWFNRCHGSLSHQQKRLLPQGLENYHVTIPRATVNGIQQDWPLVSPTGSIKFDLNGEMITIDLKRNDGLIHHAFHHSYQTNGRMQRRQNDYQPFCYYHGRLRQSRMPTVRIPIDPICKAG